MMNITMTTNSILAEENLIVPALVSHLQKFYEKLDRFWLNVEKTLGKRPCNRIQLSFTTAIVEIASNIIRHAYPIELPVGYLCLRLRLYDDYYEALLLDKGIMFTPPPIQPLVSSQVNVWDLPESGFGLHIARSSVDKLDYSRHSDGTNQWQLIKQMKR